MSFDGRCNIVHHSFLWISGVLEGTYLRREVVLFFRIGVVQIDAVNCILGVLCIILEDGVINEVRNVPEIP